MENFSVFVFMTRDYHVSHWLRCNLCTGDDESPVAIASSQKTLADYNSLAQEHLERFHGERE